MKHESAASYCKEELNILRATADTLNLQPLCFYTGLNTSTWNQAFREAFQNCERLLIARKSLNYSSFYSAQWDTVGDFAVSSQDTVGVTDITCAVWRSKKCGLSESCQFCQEDCWSSVRLPPPHLCAAVGECGQPADATRQSSSFGSPLLTHSFLRQWTERGGTLTLQCYLKLPQKILSTHLTWPSAWTGFAHSLFDSILRRTTCHILFSWQERPFC